MVKSSLYMMISDVNPGRSLPNSMLVYLGGQKLKEKRSLSNSHICIREADPSLCFLGISQVVLGTHLVQAVLAIPTLNLILFFSPFMLLSKLVPFLLHLPSFRRCTTPNRFAVHSSEGTLLRARQRVPPHPTPADNTAQSLLKSSNCATGKHLTILWQVGDRSGSLSLIPERWWQVNLYKGI